MKSDIFIKIRWWVEGSCLLFEVLDQTEEANKFLKSVGPQGFVFEDLKNVITFKSCSCPALEPRSSRVASKKGYIVFLRGIEKHEDCRRGKLSFPSSEDALCVGRSISEGLVALNAAIYASANNHFYVPKTNTVTVKVEEKKEEVKSNAIEFTFNHQIVRPIKQEGGIFIIGEM